MIRRLVGTVCAGAWLALLATAPPALASPGGELFAKVTAPRNALVLQEIFEFTVAVYSRGQVLGRDFSLSNREIPGLNFLPFQDLGSGHEELAGRTYSVRRFRGRAQPVAAGTYSLQPAVQVAVVIPRPGARGGRSSAGADLQHVDLVVEPLTVTVRPLPEAGRPEGFTGAVGAFTFRAAARPAVVVEGEPLTLTMEIRGRGNLEGVAAPPVAGGDRFEVRESRLVRKEIGEDRSQGLLVYEQVLVPRSPAAGAVPAVTFSFFDPATGSYRRATEGPFKLRVIPLSRPAGEGREARSPRPQPGTPPRAAEVVALKPEPRPWPGTGGGGLPWPWPLALQLVPLLAWATSLWYARRRDLRTRDVAGARRLLALESARAGLDAAGKSLNKGDAGHFHEEFWKALSTYLGHRLDLLPGEFAIEIVTERLLRDGVGRADVVRLAELLRFSERERFGRPAPGGSLNDEERRRLAGALEEAARLLAACERRER